MKPTAISILTLVMMGAHSMQLPAARGVAGSDLQLEEVLAHTRRSVESFWQKISSVTCTETLTQQKIGKKGKVEFKHDSVSDYLLITHRKGSDLNLEESRLVKKNVDKSKERPLLTTNGFSTLLLVFHPRYRDSYRFYLDGDDLIDGKRLIRVRYEHVAGTPSTSALELRGRVYPLDMEGVAWIDPDTQAIRRVKAELKAPMDDLNLKAFYAVVDYRPQRFASSSEVFWLPSTAAIDIETARQHWRNVHRFADYKRFSVEERIISK